MVHSRRKPSCCVLTRRSNGIPAEPAKAQAAIVEAEKVLQSLVEDWQTKTVPDFSAERQIIAGLKAKLDALAGERETRIRAMAKPVSEAEQLH